ncbi:MAG: carbohydrate binding family 9 domain-containing protein [Vicinamibacteria bacterium]|nr:carbohydrate binding family 9 domain-containing protein [Vicinamibacteria bacterium]
MRMVCVLSLLLPWSERAFGEVFSDGVRPAQEAQSGPASDPLPSFAPAAPNAPEVIARDEQGRITVRATRITEPLVLDGKLDDPVYSRVKSVSDFIQQEPDEGAPETEKTEAWIFFDDRNLYVSLRCWDSHLERMMANEMRRDHPNIRQDENFSLVLDTYYDRRSGYYFATNPLGAVRDQAIGDEGRNNNLDWNTVWDVKASMDERGWALEMVIPFKSMRYNRVGPQVWSFNLRRTVKWKNETSSLAPLQRARGGRGLFIFSEAATLVGVEIPGSNRNLEVKPYGLSSLTTDRTAEQPFSNHPDADFGFDAKYGLTSGLIGDFTFNTDFAQVEEDQQEVNLTRFSLLFPEKREFFLEGQAIFAFGGGSPGGGGDGLAPIPFFSRRIGLTEEGQDPIRVGGRVAGRAGPFQIGALDIQTRGVADNPLIQATNFSVLRVRRDIFTRGDIGIIGTHRSTSLTEGARSNSLFGADANFAFFQNLNLNASYLTSRTSLEQGGTTGGDHSSYRGNLEYGGDRYGLVLEHIFAGKGFQPELGFLKREAFRRNFLEGRFSPRPRSIDWVRRFVWQGNFDRITDPGGRLETRMVQGLFRTEFENSDQVEVEYTNTFEFLPKEFEIAKDVVLPVGEYGFQDVKLTYTLGAQRTVPGKVSYQKGSFWSGDRDAVTFDGRIQVGSKFSLEPRLSLNWVDLPEGDFNTRLFGARANVTFSPRMALSGYVQYNSKSDSLSSSLRFRWEYQPGSDLFVVYSEGRGGFSEDPLLTNRTLALKFTRLFRF